MKSPKRKKHRMNKKQQQQLQEDFSREFVLFCQGPSILLEFEPVVIWSLMSAVQLALRHPNFNGPTARYAADAVRQIEEKVALTPALKQVAEMGWHKEYDQ